MKKHKIIQNAMIKEIRSLQNKISDLHEKNYREFVVWTDILDYVVKAKGKTEAINLVRVSLSDKEKIEKALKYINNAWS